MEISESAWAKAKEIANDWAMPETELAAAEAIARAIMQERRECAEIAREFGENEFRDQSLVRGAAYSSEMISQAIRNK